MLGLKLLFGFILIFMLTLTAVTSLQSNLFDALPGMLQHPWTVAALWDAYSGFLTFYLWVAYKETRWLARTLWFVLIMALGNIAMSAYVPIQVWKLPKDASVEALLLRRPAVF